MEQFFTPARRLQDGNQVPGLTILSITLVALKCRPVEEFLNYDWDWDWEALLALSRGCAESKCMDHSDMPLMIGGVHQFFLDDDSHTIVY
jgi:hypothetical protein